MTIFTLNIFWFTIAPSYYWLMYALSFLIGYFLLLKRKFLSKEQLDDLFLYIFLWVLLWWRIWYILFYDLWFFIQNPQDIIKVWEWWMSFHGWALWVIISILLYSKIKKESFLKIADEIAFVAPIWLLLWRIWNYLNKELLWFPYNWPLAVEKDWNYFFPSPLVESFLEWFILFFILLFVSSKRKFYWQIWASFLIFYGIFRFLVEIFLRTPDPQIWYIFGFLTMWSLLSLPMIITWIFFLYFLRNKDYAKLK